MTNILPHFSLPPSCADPYALEGDILFVVLFLALACKRTMLNGCLPYILVGLRETLIIPPIY